MRIWHREKDDLVHRGSIRYDKKTVAVQGAMRKVRAS